LIRELIDNSLDACESAGVPPVITVRLEPDAITVSDNGPGLPGSIIERSLDHGIRVSDKKGYVSLTRGHRLHDGGRFGK
jgi:DNA topoisomerase VI subunit B